MSRSFLCCIILFLLAPTTVWIDPPVHADEVSPDRQHVVIVVGAAGSAEYGQQFREWARRWTEAAESGGAGHQVIGLDEGTDDRTVLADALNEAKSVETKEPLWILFIGHGTHDGRTTRFNLRGQDITAEDTAALLQDVRRPIALMNCASCSAPFINAVSGPGRVVVSATKDSAQFQFARFGDYLSQAIGDLRADLDRDSQVSLLEAWVFASQRTSEFYESEGRLATEHSLLDDNGDGRGVRASVFEGVQLRTPEELTNPDGQLARQWHLVRSDDERRLTSEQREERDRLEVELEHLRKRAGDLSGDQYLDELENVLLQLARIYQSAEQQAPPANQTAR